MRSFLGFGVWTGAGTGHMHTGHLGSYMGFFSGNAQGRGQEKENDILR